MPSANIYVSVQDRRLIGEAARYIQFHERKSLSAYIVEHLRAYVRKAKAKEARSK
jgi:hypothetical protein